MELARLSSTAWNAVYIHLTLDQGGLDPCADTLREAVFYGGVLAESQQRDWLIMQYTIGPEPESASVKLSGERAKQLLKFILSDKHAVEKPTKGQRLINSDSTIN